MRNIDWSGLYKEGRDYTFTSTNELTKILNKIKTSGKAIDLGCGTGHLTRELYHRGFKVTGIDSSDIAIEIATEASSYIKYIQADLEESFPGIIKKNKYNLITCKLVFAFIKNEQDFINQTKDLLDKNGAFVIITPTLEQVVPEKLHIAVDKEKTLNLLKSAFKKVSYYQSLGFTVFIAKS